MAQEKDKILERSGQQDDPVLLLEKGKRGVLNVVFGRSMLILVMLGLQILLLVLAFGNSVRAFTPFLYGVLMVFYAG